MLTTDHIHNYYNLNRQGDAATYAAVLIYAFVRPHAIKKADNNERAIR